MDLTEGICTDKNKSFPTPQIQLKPSDTIHLVHLQASLILPVTLNLPQYIF
jgi:hypothetical protein